MDNTTFEIQKFDIKLETSKIGRNFIFADEIESTNSYLLDKENKIDIFGTVLLAEKQTQGRGRFNREWNSAHGQNLTFSIFIKPSAQLTNKLNLLNLGTSLVVSQTIDNLFQVKTELKWPNDVLINKKKVSGILLESVSTSNVISRLVVGIGINVNQTSFPGEYNIPPTSIKFEYGQQIEREKLLAELLNNFEEMLKKIEDEPDSIIKEWRRNCRMIGEKISISQLDKIRYGVFEDIDDEGFLLLKTENKIEKISFGDVSVS